jgi:O-antigen/teichoic acid export membrane protein
MLAVKLVAVLQGPAQVALLATLQQLRQTAVTGATLTGQTALVQGASGQQGRARREYVRTVLVLFALAAGLVSAALAIFPEWVARQAGLGAQHAPAVAWLCLAVLSATAYVFLAALLNAAGEVGKLALAQLVSPGALAVLAYPVASHGAWANGSGFTLMLTGSSAAATLAAAAALWQRRVRVRDWFTGEGRWWSPSAARRFFAISGAMFASGLFSSWALIAVRARILSAEGYAVGGQFDAAWAISMQQTGLVLASLQAYYLPALARTPEAAARSAQIGRVLTVAAAVAAAGIVALAAMKPWVLRMLYSEQFTGAARYLRWTLAGDYLKVSSWTLSIPLVAAGNMRAFLSTDLAAYGAFFAAAGLLSNYAGPAEAAAMAFVIMYAVHLVFCGACLWSREEFRPSARTAAVWLAGLMMVGAASAAFWSQI